MRLSLAGSFSLIFHLSNAKKKIQGSCPFHNGDILNRLMPHSHQSLNMFKSCFVKHSLIFFSS